MVGEGHLHLTYMNMVDSSIGMKPKSGGVNSAAQIHLPCHRCTIATFNCVAQRGYHGGLGLEALKVEK